MTDKDFQRALKELVQRIEKRELSGKISELNIEYGSNGIYTCYVTVEQDDNPYAWSVLHREIQVEM